MITIYSILFFYSISVLAARPLIKRVLEKYPMPPQYLLAAQWLPYFPVFNTIFLLNYLWVSFKQWQEHIKARRLVKGIIKKYGLPPYKPDRGNKTQDRRQWFQDRVGKRVYRNANGCYCNKCASVVANGMLINDQFHADYLYENESEYNIEGTPLRYWDTKEEV